jgi:hypothetical protein
MANEKNGQNIICSGSYYYDRSDKNGSLVYRIPDPGGGDNMQDKEDLSY